MSKLKRLLVSTAAMVMIFAINAGFANAESSNGIVTGDQVNLREAPNTSAAVLTRLEEGTQVSIVGASEGWYNVNFGELTGWINGQFVSVGDSASVTGYITGSNVNIRGGAGTWADVVTKLNDGDKVSVVGRSFDWINIQTADSTIGWVRKDFISIGASRGDETGRQIVSFARKFLGVRYVYGGSTPNGFDCSGFVKHVYSGFGVNLERVAADQANQGVRISKAELRMGDLVFFDTDGGSNYINHVGIYIGNGNFIHASSGGAKGVTISDLGGFYANSYMAARRIVR